MTINVWFNAEKSTYKIRYDGRIYERKSYIAAKELIESFLANLVLKSNVAA